MNSFNDIDINLIHAHPDNPRKDLGDLTELAESIKARGILQNLTVVLQAPGYCISCQLYNGSIGKCTENHDKNERPPCSKWASKGHFTVVIGHRRLAAAKLAGLETVPCVISDMNHREQVATMLLENIQRSDLTPIEQAQGFQMMMDLGDTVAGISEKTGFSDSTIRKRLNLAKLDQDKLQESYMRGGTLMDYAELEKIKSEKQKNELLLHIGTGNFQWKLKQALDEQELPGRKAALIAEIDSFAKTVGEKEARRYVNVNGFYNFKKPQGWKIPADADKTEYFYTVSDYSVGLYKKPDKTAPKKMPPKEKAFKEREAQLKQLAEQAYESRRKFVKSFSAGKKYSAQIRMFVFKQLLGYRNCGHDDLLKLFDTEIPSGKNYDPEVRTEKLNLILEKYCADPEHAMLVAAYASIDDPVNGYHYAQSWNNFKISYRENGSLDALYDDLISLGYEMSEEEQQLRNGSHELFDKSEETV